MGNKNDDEEKKKKKRKMKSKARRPKYLSLSKHIKKKASEAAEITKMTPQLNLFPLHPENLVVDDRSFADENVALLFDSESAAGDASLTGLLRPSSSEHDGSPSHEPVFDDGESLVRTAMKRRHGGSGEEEKWVSYSEVVEEVTSSSSKDVVWRGKKRTRIRVRTTSSNNNSEGNSVISTGTAGLSFSLSPSSSSLALKLDYQEILKAWSDKGPLYIQAQPSSPSPQTVPDLQYDLGLMDGWGSNAGNLWKVPENEGIKIKEELDGLKLGQREASVLRYKEKRQSRLFAKRIRYEVRKLNAEKRPRIKGRFVKIS